MLKLWLLFACFNLELLLRVSCKSTPVNKTRVYPNCYRHQDTTCPNANITFQLYSSVNSHGSLEETSSLEDFNARTAMPLKVLIHGFDGDRHSAPNGKLLKELRRLRNINIVSVEYKNLVLDPCYTEGVHNAPFVGRCLATFLLDLLGKGVVAAQQLHLIGFGLGAHVAGFASNFLAQAHYKVGHITGLDPAKPLFLTTNLDERLDRTDADFVDIIHTDVFLHSIMQPIGHVDFYPNMGVSQPECGPIDQLSTHLCYHQRAAEYYAESIVTSPKFWGFRCSDLYSFTIGECQPTEDLQLMGYRTSPKARGNYFLATNKLPPYAKGKDFTNMDRSLYGKTYLGDSIMDKLYRMGTEFQKITVNIG